MGRAANHGRLGAVVRDSFSGHGNGDGEIGRAVAGWGLIDRVMLLSFLELRLFLVVYSKGHYLPQLPIYPAGPSDPAHVSGTRTQCSPFAPCLDFF